MCCRTEHYRYDGSEALPNAEGSYQCYESYNAVIPSRTSCIQVAVSIVFHKAVAPVVVTHIPVVLTSEMVAVYPNASHPLDDVNR